MKINECIIVSKEINDKFILAKNRDRTYRPVLRIVREIINGIEVAYLHDMKTDWSEGMNAKGIGAVNAALMVGADEDELKMIKKSGKKSLDGEKMRNIIQQHTLKDAIKGAVIFRGNNTYGIKGHTFIASPDYLVSLENTLDKDPVLTLQNMENPIVRTNHGQVYTSAGYTQGLKQLSSHIRRITAQKSIDQVTDWTQIGAAMRTKLFDDDSELNMARDTEKMETSSQTVMNLTDKILMVEYYPDRVEKFIGIVNKLPEGYTPTIKIVVKKIEESKN